ncbi:hybrid sensor histidine kinase/response regulator [Rhizobium sp. TH2]|uniref:hybrid sensor histidine kinase/response regulator n=1 Tax=Rhizobium sp. TH2 TaxID=2775403 RepID=UPI002157200C|nr:PAS domain-containing hybrid sensor histidine kinase/response regulator [Rhizobium sp. TH2]UVC09704.1 hybrid sensor histidine kinase/response regulator [Rhizobium sp. TH2]
MLPGWVIFGSAIAYLVLLFGVASYGDRRTKNGAVASGGRPLVYALSLAIYCTSWTYFGGVGLAASRGFEFTAIYIGPMLVFTVGLPLLRRITEIAKAERLTSIADFIAARYGKNPVVAMIVAFIALAGAVPYIALQLKAISSSVGSLVDTSQYAIGLDSHQLIDLPLLVSLSLAFFAVVFGTRHADATEHQDGLILAIATESLVKLIAILTVGLTVLYGIFDGPAHLWELAKQNALAQATLSHSTPISRWIVVILLSAFAIIMLPRQFHVMVVENRTFGELKLAAFFFPLYLVLINIFVLPIAIGGLIHFNGTGNADLYVLALPLSADMPWVTMIAFIGGFSAATAMVIVASVALSIMISNDIVMPVLLRRNLVEAKPEFEDISKLVLGIRRGAIFAVLLLGYAYYRSAGTSGGLASIGLIAFAAIAQMAPAMIGGLYWRRANARGAIAGLTTGFAVWVWMLFVPSLGGTDTSADAAAILDAFFPFGGMFGPGSDSFVNAVILSLFVNTTAFVLGSLSRNAKGLERQQADVFIPHANIRPHRRTWRTNLTIGDLKLAIGRYLGEERMLRSFTSYEEELGRKLKDKDLADADLMNFAEQLLGSAIGSSSARLVLSLSMRRMDDQTTETAMLLDQASEALQYNQGMLQTALSQMDQGIAVFDAEKRLTIWNRRFRTLLDLPEQAGQVGFQLASIIDILKARGDIGMGEEEDVIEKILTPDTPFLIVLDGGARIVELRSNPMPDLGMVTTCTDITERVQANRALEEANETLEQRVAERTQELTRVNTELAEARASAEEANIGKTRFFAAAGHDILQPLNAARLYSSSLVERLGRSSNSDLVQNIDSALESVETILGAVLDISRLDTGAMKPRLSTVALDDFLKRIDTDYQPLARAQGLTLKVLPTSLKVKTDPTLLRRLVQNLVSNAIKYTIKGRVLVGVRRRGNEAWIQVYDTGIGIPSSKFKTVFKEFARLDEGARTASGLGLGLSIVDRISRVLSHPVELQSTPGKGTVFRVRLPLDQTSAVPLSTEPASTMTRPGQKLDGLRVLCIDNEPAILDGMKILLSGWGCVIETAASLAECEDIIARQWRPDAVIADYHLGDGNGITAIARLRLAFGPLPGILITADRTPEVRALADRDGIAQLNKPVKPAALRASLSRIAGVVRQAAE